MKGAGKIRNFDFDPTENAQNMSVFEFGEGKEWIETALAEKLLPNSAECPKDDERFLLNTVTR
jgi:hypothetical protein